MSCEAMGNRQWEEGAGRGRWEEGELRGRVVRGLVAQWPQAPARLEEEEETGGGVGGGVLGGGELWWVFCGLRGVRCRGEAKGAAWIRHAGRG